ncbi:MAG: hypothetical protein ACREUC_01700 [Steroidobacteraceae bacterium]
MAMPWPNSVRAWQADTFSQPPKRFAGKKPQLTESSVSGRNLSARAGICTYEHRTTAGHVQKIEESVMNAVAEFSLNTQRVVCMLLSAVIVAGWISLGAYTAESASHDGYSVTITQLE